MNRTVSNYQDFTQQRKESIQRQLIQQEKISANHSSNKGLIFKNIHGTRTPEDNKTNDLIKEGAKGRNRRFKEGRRAANKYLKVLGLTTTKELHIKAQWDSLSSQLEWLVYLYTYFIHTSIHCTHTGIRIYEKKTMKDSECVENREEERKERCGTAGFLLVHQRNGVTHG